MAGFGGDKLDLSSIESIVSVTETGVKSDSTSNEASQFKSAWISSLDFTMWVVSR